MNIKEKAIELVNKFYDATDDHWNQDFVAKKCALIAVDELIKVACDLDIDETVTKLYWQEVKKEIEKL
jgi:hypothetical protein